MKQNIVELVAFLKSQTAFTNVMGSGNSCRLYPFVAKEETPFPFATYGVGSVPYTKNARQDQATVYLYFDPNRYVEMLQFADAITPLLEEKYDVGPIETDYNKDYNAIFTIITINLD